MLGADCFGCKASSQSPGTRRSTRNASRASDTPDLSMSDADDFENAKENLSGSNSGDGGELDGYEILFEDDEEVEQYSEIDSEDEFHPDSSDDEDQRPRKVAKKEEVRVEVPPESAPEEQPPEPEPQRTPAPILTSEPLAEELPVLKSDTESKLTPRTEEHFTSADDEPQPVNSLSYIESELQTAENSARSSAEPIAVAPAPAPASAPAPTPASPPPPTAEAPRRSTRRPKKQKTSAASLGISEADLQDIEEVYEIAADPESEVFHADNIEDAVAALGFSVSPQELQEIIATADPSSSGIVDHDLFVEIMALKYQERNKELRAAARKGDTGSSHKVEINEAKREELEDAFELFIEHRQDQRYITIDDLRKVAEFVKDNVTDEDLQEMLRVASGNAYGTVNFENFAAVMQDSGAIV
ncbi:hypothetical protein BZA70DRAFT_283648 [Myxozyma melibiosi]|uniref:EF-hand domain-containing protein n=1 Tax=Myxozyma melibiosi TaxID=54550 RepID=A0ABR1F0W3_9ASCO